MITGRQTDGPKSKFRHGGLMQNVVVNRPMCEKFHNDQLRNDRSLGNGKSDNKNNNKNNVVGLGDPSSGLQMPKAYKLQLQTIQYIAVVNFHYSLTGLP